MAVAEYSVESGSIGRNLKLVLAGVVVSVFLAGSAEAYTLTFESITNINPTNVAVGEAQMFVDVTDLGGGEARFHFTNIGPEASSITHVYFDDPYGVFSGINALDNGPGVNFSIASDINLPYGRGFGFYADDAASALFGLPVNGVDPGEYLGVVMGLSASFEDMTEALLRGELRIVGIKVRGFEDGGWESFVAKPIPEPASMALFGLGSVVVGAAVRRRAA